MGVGKDQYSEYLDLMINGRILPWTQDEEVEGYPVWTDWEAVQRTVFFLNTSGDIDTSFNITPFDPNNPEDFSYIRDLILELRDPLQYNLITVPHEYPTIQEGIDVAENGDTVLVSPGTYVENINFNGKNIIVGSLFLTTQDTSYISQTIIDGSNPSHPDSGSVVLFVNGENSYAMISGFKIQNGSGTRGIENEYNFVGGGIAAHLSSPIIENLIVENNSCDVGGGIYCQEANPMIRNLIIKINFAEGGGGISLRNGSQPVIKNSTICNNQADYGGGAIRALQGSNFLLKNCLIYNNISGHGIIYLWNSSMDMTNTTMISNEITFLHLRGYFNTKIINSIVRDHYPGEELTFFDLHPSSQLTFLYNNLDFDEDDISDEYGLEINGGEGNHFDDPNFSDSYFNNYNLEIPSPCIDSGHPDLDGDGFTWEIDPDDRDPDGTRMDMGAFYHHHEAGDYPIIVEYNNGWNMVGLPLTVGDSHYQSLFSSIFLGSLYGFDGMYTSEEYLTEGTGYLLRFTEDTEVVYEGVHLSEIDIPVVGGWNLISGISTLVSVNHVYSSSIVYPGTVYGFNGTYVNADYIIPGRGYWARVMHDGNIYLSSGLHQSKEIPEIVSHFPTNKLIFSNGVYSTELFLDIPTNEKTLYSYSLPPLFDGLNLDVRYTGDWKIPIENNLIQIKNKERKLSVNFHTDHLQEAIILKSEKGNRFELSSGETINLPEHTRFLTVQRHQNIRESFSLFKTYPNPFNSKLRIVYQVQNPGEIKINIYNIRGNLVKTLTDNFHQSGPFQLDWNGDDRFGLPVSSGVYLVVIHNGIRLKTQKCILLK